MTVENPCPRKRVKHMQPEAANLFDQLVFHNERQTDLGDVEPSLEDA
jgi:hypothetical protein